MYPNEDIVFDPLVRTKYRPIADAGEEYAYDFRRYRILLWLQIHGLRRRLPV